MSSMQNKEMKEAARLEEAGNWLLRLREDAWSEADTIAWVDWCESDPENLQAFESLQALWCSAGEHRPDSEAMARLLQPDPAVPTSDVHGGAFSIPRTVARKPALSWRMVRYALAASLAFLVFAVSQHYIQGSRYLEQGRAVAVVDSLATPLARNQHSTLPDGSGIDVAARSVVDIDFTGMKRRLQLRDGEAFFKVRHDPKHPFVVEAAGIQVTAVGTAFDVRREGVEVTVTVKEGIVRVSQPGQDVPEGVQKTLVSETAGAGYQVAIDTTTGRVRRSIVDADAALAWREGRLEFAGDNLDAVLLSVNRYSARPIVLADPSLGSLTFTGTIFFGSIDAWLDGLQQVFPVTVDRSSRDRIILSRSGVVSSLTIVAKGS